MALLFPKLQTAIVAVTLMSKMPRFSTLSDSQHVKGSQKLLKSARQQFHNMCSSLWEYFSQKKYFLVMPEIFRTFFNTLILDDKYSLGNRENLGNQFKCDYLKNYKFLLNFLLHFSNLHLTSNMSNKKMSLIVHVFAKL